MAEICEQAGTGNVDQLSFKAYLSRCLAATSVVLPSTAGTINPPAPGIGQRRCGIMCERSRLGDMWYEVVYPYMGRHPGGWAAAGGIGGCPRPASRLCSCTSARQARRRAEVLGLKMITMCSLSLLFVLYSILSSFQCCIARRVLQVSDEHSGRDQMGG
jgi:hypothetical protein